MRHRRRTSAQDGGLLILLGVFVLGLILTVTGVWSPSRLARGPMPMAIVANGDLPPAILPIKDAEARDAQLMMAALDRIGFDLDAVAKGYISVPRLLVSSLPPDLERLDAMDSRKTLFLRLMLPMVLAVNEQIGSDRQHLLEIKADLANNVQLAALDVQWVLGIADLYDQPDADVDALLRKVDVIPPSVALAQAIVESGWGTSRIARTQNSLFGQFGQAASGDWDYRSFDNLHEGVTSYMRNLNTHRAYREFRDARSKMRRLDGEIDGWELAAALHRYSERGDDYVHDLHSIMRDNDLESFDYVRLNTHLVAAIVASN
jgi:Bax protein